MTDPAADAARSPLTGAVNSAATGSVTKAVIPAAGMGTRFLPASKAVPKELLPIVDTPAIEYVVAEASSVGLRDVLMITGRGKAALEEHFDRNAELERALEAKDDDAKLEKVRRSTDLATIHFVRQGDPLGLGHAVLCAAEHVGDQPFAVLLGDDLIDPRDPLLATMIEVRERYGGSVVALLEVPPEQVYLYGCAAVQPIEDSADPDVVLVTGLVEKPLGRGGPEQPGGDRALPPRPLRLRRPAPDRARARRRDPADRRLAAPRRVAVRPGPGCAASSSAAAATTPATGWSTSRRSSGWPASTPSWVRTSPRGWAASWRGRPRGDPGRGASAADPRRRRTAPPGRAARGPGPGLRARRGRRQPDRPPRLRQLGDGRVRREGRRPGRRRPARARRPPGGR